MDRHSDRQLEILRKIGIDVWKQRSADSAGDPGLREVVTASAETLISRSTVSPEQVSGSSLDSIALAVKSCQKCELHRSRTNTVFGCGNARADWLFIGEAPGQHEDRLGLPFVGRAGKLLDMMIAALGMKREQVYIANVLKCRPPGNRDPLPAEVEQCEPYLHQQLANIKPRVIVALGRISAQALLKTTEPLGKLRGSAYQYGPENIPLVVTYHPAYLLRSPEHKGKAWEDLWQAKMIVDQHET